ncbi:MAG TPA: hypothetical protein VGK52_14550 [Polyangia bacterium]|jgi:hypothetical protein
MRRVHSLTRILGAVGVCAAIGSSLLLSGCGSADDQRPAQWSYIYPAIIEPSCATASCHSDFTRRAGVNFGFSDEAYFQLTQRHFVVQCAAPPATPDAACLARAVDDSEVIHLMRAEGASRMPPDFPLPDADIQLIGAWIANNALNN